MSDVLKLKEYPTEQLIELAFAAYRVNGGYVKDTRRYSEDQPTTYSNKEIVAYSAAHYNQYNEKDSVVKTWIPSDFIPVKVTDEDRIAIENAHKHMRRYVMLALGNLSDFQKDIFSAYSSETMPVNRIGLIAYLPQFVERELHDKMYKARLKKEFSDSQYYEKKVDGNVEILKVIRISREFEDAFYMHFGAINGNLICFSRKEAFAVGNVYVLTAKVKAQDRERETGLPMTRVNYVKLKKTEF